MRWWILGSVLAIVAIIAVPISMLVGSYLFIPAAPLRSAYTLGIRVGLDNDDLDEIGAGKIPRIDLRQPVPGQANSYIWQTGTLIRPGYCLEADHKIKGARILCCG